MSERLMKILSEKSNPTQTKYKEKKKKRKLENKDILERKSRLDEQNEEAKNKLILQIDNDNMKEKIDALFEDSESENEKTKEKIDLFNVSRAINSPVSSYIDSSKRGKHSNIHLKSDSEIFGMLADELNRTLITESDTDTDNFNENKSDYIITPSKFFSNDRDNTNESFNLEFEQYEEICSTRICEKSKILASIMINPTRFVQKSNINNNKLIRPSVPQLSPEYIQKYLVQPRGLLFGERACRNERRCESLIASAKNFSNKQNEFILREFLLPHEEEAFQTRGILPTVRKLCVLCNIQETYEVYCILRENDRKINIGVNDLMKLYPQTIKLEESQIENSPACFYIQDHSVSIANSLVSGSTKYYPSNSILDIDPHVGLVLPFRKPNFNRLHVTTIRLPVDAIGNVGSFQCYVETDVQNFQ